MLEMSEGTWNLWLAVSCRFVLLSSGGLWVILYLAIPSPSMSDPEERELYPPCVD